MKRFTLFITICFILFNHQFVQAQNNLRFYNLTIENGLSQNTVNCITQDQSGFLWVGTEDGLNRFDGISFKTFRSNIIDSNSIASNVINDLLIDKTNNLWIATNNGLSIFNLKSGKINSYYNSITNHRSLPSNEVLRVLNAPNSDLWLFTKNFISKFDKQKNKFVNYNIDTLRVNFLKAYSYPVIMDNKGIIWIGTLNGILLFDTRTSKIFSDKKNKTITKNYLFNNLKVFSIYQDKAGIYWIGSDQGLFKYNFTKDQLERCGENNKQLNTSLEEGFLKIYEDNQERFWLGTWGYGLDLFNKKNGTIHNFSHNRFDPLSIGDDYIKTIYQDRSGTLWIGTSSNGICRVNSGVDKFLHLKPDSIGTKNVKSNNILSIIEDVNHNLWLGSKGNGLIYKDHKTGRQEIINRSTNAKLPANEITVLCLDYRESIWIGTTKGIAKINTITKKISSGFMHLDRLKDENLNYIETIYKDRKDVLWIGTNGGLISYDLKTGDEELYTNCNITNSISSNEIRCIGEDRFGNIWIGTNGEGLNKLNPNTGLFTIYKKEKHNGNSICDNKIISLLATNDSIIWIGTSAGLSKFNILKNNFKNYTTNEGLINSYIYNIQDDEDNNIWFSTNKGLSRLTASGTINANYDISDGLQGLEFNANSNFKARDGKLYLGGVNGYNTFNPTSLPINYYLPPIVFTSFKIQNKEMVFDSLITFKKNITINYKENFRIEFAALNYSFSEKNNYRYYLQGYNKEWINIGNKNYATFENIPPGIYTLHVKGSNNDNIWSKKEAVFTITIKPPYYMTTWFRFLIVLVFIVTIRLVFNARTSTLRNKNKVLEDREEIAKEVALQKEELSRKNQDLTESLNYARIIQKSILHTDNKLLKKFSDSFIYFAPKTIVSGDFFWIHERNNNIYIAVVDCTGHGVPGAIMSISANAMLNKALFERKLSLPGNILEEINRNVLETFQVVGDSQIKDGMDITLCSIDLEKMSMIFSGAYNPIFHIRNGKLTQIRGERYPIGLFNDDEIEGFSDHLVQLAKGDVIYMFTDGYVDQFGGGEGKKFKNQQFKELLLSIQDKSMEEQKKIIDTTITQWRNNEEQIDDMLIIGIKI